MITVNGKEVTRNVPVNRTDFGRLLIARIHMKQLLTQLGQAESEIAHLEHRVRQLEEENYRLKA